MAILVNVRDYGALGDGTTDDRAAILAAIAAVKSLSAPPASAPSVALVFPKGKYAISNTIEFNTFYGLTILGEGALRSTSFLSGSNFTGSHIVPKPGANAPSVMLDFPSCDGVIIRGLSVQGNPAGFTRAAVGIRIAQPSTGSSTANFLIDDVVVHECDVALQAGVSGTSATSSDWTLNRFAAKNCTTAFLTAHAQAVNYNFISPQFDTVTTGFDLSSGSLYASQLSTYDVDVLVRVQGGGQNLGPVVVDQARLDGPSSGGVRTQLFVSENAGYYLAEFRAITTCVALLNTAGSSRVVLRNGNYVKLVGCGDLVNGDLTSGASGASYDAISQSGTSAKSVLDIVRCPLPWDDSGEPGNWDRIEGTVAASGMWRVRDCVQGNGAAALTTSTQFQPRPNAEN